MANEFSISEIYSQAFGKEPPPDFGIEPASARREFSSAGQPYFSADDLGREFYLPIRINGMLIPFGTISIDLRKTIVSEPMPQRRGSVHEIINVDDYVFNIKGVLLSLYDSFPEADYNALVELFHVNASIRLENVKTAPLLKGDDKVLITSVPLPASPGMQQSQVFEINCVSDLIYTLELSS